MASTSSNQCRTHRHHDMRPPRRAAGPALGPPRYRLPRSPVTRLMIVSAATLLLGAVTAKAAVPTAQLDDLDPRCRAALAHLDPDDEPWPYRAALCQLSVVGQQTVDAYLSPDLTLWLEVVRPPHVDSTFASGLYEGWIPAALWSDEIRPRLAPTESLVETYPPDQVTDFDCDAEGLCYRRVGETQLWIQFEWLADQIYLTEISLELVAGPGC